VAEIIWSQEAQEDLRAIRKYVARDNPTVADRIIDDLVASAQLLSDFPTSGRTVEELKQERVREIIVTPYYVAYHASGDSVEILKVWHGKRMLRPEEFRA
jgi:toxin ParE1/3/4